MKWITKNGREVDFPIHRYYIDWDKPTRSKEQDMVKTFLRLHCKSHVILEEAKIPNEKIFVDFIDLTLKMAIEHQSSKNGHHMAFNKFFHKSKNGFLKSLKRDEDKRAALERNGFVLVETFKENLPLTPDFFWREYQIRI